MRGFDKVRWLKPSDGIETKTWLKNRQVVETRWGNQWPIMAKMAKNGKEFYGEVGSDPVKNSPYLAIFRHNFLEKFGQYNLAYARNWPWTLSLAHFLNSMK